MYKVILFILLIASILVTIWFKDGYILGTAEDGLPFYKLSHFKPEADYAWMEHPGLGRSTLYLTASRPTYIALTWLQDNGVPGFVIQAGVLWLMLMISGLGMYLLVWDFFPKIPKAYLLLAPLFYWFNPISLVNVWNRFLLDYIFFFSLLPITSFLFIKGLKAKKYLWGFILALFIPLYSYAFNYLAFFILIWVVFSLWTLFYFLVTKKGSVKFFYIKYFLLTICLFALTNAWWISQIVGLQFIKDFDSTIHNINTETNLGILNALSMNMGNLGDIFRLNNASFFQYESLPWVKFFYSLPIIFAEFSVVAIIFYAIIKGRKDASILVLAGLFFISVFLAKGNNPPLGEIYEFLFKNIFVLQIFRNPFEKSGFILLLPVSVLLSFGVYSFIKDIVPKFEKVIYLVVLLYILLIWGYPFFTGLVFTSKFPPTNDYETGYKVKVPKDYQQADQWLENQGKNFRAIGFPLEDEGVTYKWEKGYTGVELSTALFSVPVILHRTAVPYYFDLVTPIQNVLLSEQDFYKLANILNARFLFVREDIDFQTRKMTDPLVIKKNLISREQQGEIKKVSEFGKLTFWENIRWKDSTFYPANIVKVSLDQKFADLLTIDVQKGEVLTDRIYPVDSKGLLNDLRITYKRINPSEYNVSVKGATSSFILVFSELYNKGWQASLNNDEITEHFRVNNYANGWLVDKPGDFDLKIKFTLQKWLDIGEWVSLISYLTVLILIVYYFLQKKLQKRT